MMCRALIRSLRRIGRFDGSIVVLARRHFTRWLLPGCHVVTTTAPPFLARMRMDELIPELGRTEAVVWLDSDVLVCRPGIGELFDLGGKSLRLAREVGIRLGGTSMRPFVYFLSEDERRRFADLPGANSGTWCCAGPALGDFLSLWRRTHFHDEDAAPERYDQASLNALIARGEWPDHGWYDDVLVQFPLVARERGHPELLCASNLVHHYIGMRSRRARLARMRRDLAALERAQDVRR
jgi:hypothetical protein